MAVVLDNSADSLFLAGNHSLVPQVNSCWVKTKRLLSSSTINLPDSIYKLANTSSVDAAATSKWNNWNYWQNYWIMRLWSSDWLSHQGIWAIIHMVTVIKNELKNRLLLQIKSGKILHILWAFLIKELFHSRLLDMRRLSTISYPTRTRGIIVKYPKHCYCHLEVPHQRVVRNKGKYGIFPFPSTSCSVKKKLWRALQYVNSNPYLFQ